MSLVKEVLIVPLLAQLGIHPPDPTFGRYLAPLSEYETVIEQTAQTSIKRRRVFFARKGSAGVDVGQGQDVSLKPSELDAPGVKGKGMQWACYQIWESSSEEAKKGKGRGCDLVLLHGMCDYGEKWGPHSERFLKNGFRLIVPDLAAHGRSTGVHVHLSSPYDLTDSVHAVVTDVARWSPDPIRKMFFAGSSMGGWTSIAYATRYPKSPTPIGGVFLIAPLLGIAPEAMPPQYIYLIGRALQHVAGRLPITPAIKGKVSDDPRVEAEFFADPRCYHGDMRIATGLSILSGLQQVVPSGTHIVASHGIPLRIVHGSNDRTTDHRRSMDFVNAVKHERDDADAECMVYEGYEHVMLKVGIDEEDDKKRQAVLQDMLEWLLVRAE